jgi:hypothetical protein
MSDLSFPSNWFASVEDVERWADSRLSPAWQTYHRWRRRTPAALRERGMTSGEWPAGTPPECVTLHIRLTTRERVAGAVFGDYPPIAVVLARDPEAVRYVEEVWRRELMRPEPTSDHGLIGSNRANKRRDANM